MDNLKSNIYNRNLLKKINNKYILKQIFDYLKQSKYLEIIKYSKMIQNRLNININNYKEYLQTEIEIIPKVIGITNTFINISNKKNCYFYFNDSKKKLAEIIFIKKIM